MKRSVVFMFLFSALAVFAEQESERTPEERVRRAQAERDAQRMNDERVRAQERQAVTKLAPSPSEETPEQRMIRVDEIAKQRGLNEAQRAQLYREEQKKAEAAKARADADSARKSAAPARKPEP